MESFLQQSMNEEFSIKVILTVVESASVLLSQSHEEVIGCAAKHYKESYSLLMCCKEELFERTLK